MRTKPLMYRTIYTDVDHVDNVTRNLHEIDGIVDMESWETEECYSCGATLNADQEYEVNETVEAIVCEQCSKEGR